MLQSLRALAAPLVPAGLKRRLRHELRVADMEFMLARLRGAGFSPRVAIDAGAYRGEWTRLCRRIFPDVSVLMIEPQLERRGDLDRVRHDLPGCEVVSTLLGKREGSARFLRDESNSRIIYEAADHRTHAAITVQMQSLATVASETIFSFPDLLKLDVQGSELDVLAGAGALLEHAEVLILEMSVIPIGPVPLALEVMNYMRDRGYRLYDLGGFNYRPLDTALWQMDGFFVREDSSLIASRDWS
jgi:FkbM family methyltransferase